MFCRDGPSFLGNDLVYVRFNDLFDFVIVLVGANVDVQIAW